MTTTDTSPWIDYRFYFIKKNLGSQKKKQTNRLLQYFGANDVNCTAEKIQLSLIFTGLQTSQWIKVVNIELGWWRHGWTHSKHIQTNLSYIKIHHCTGYEQQVFHLLSLLTLIAGSKMFSPVKWTNWRVNCETIAIRPTALGSWYHRYPLDMTYRCGGEGLEYTF